VGPPPTHGLSNYFAKHGILKNSSRVARKTLLSVYLLNMAFLGFFCD
jgi:hypothetical protein